jgi:hypothetical protein
MVFLDGPPAGTVCAGGTNGGPLHFCALEASIGPRTYAASVDVNTDVDCDRMEAASGGQPSLCLVMATDMTIMAGATITAHGSRPLVLVSMGTLTVSGIVDVSSHAAGMTGAAANDASCTTANGGLPQQASTSTSGGGAGGSFGTAGGAGGAPGNGTAVAAEPAINGAQLTRLRGGCRGGDGGRDHDGHFGAGGASGGAVYLMATTQIDLKGGQVLANGAAGGGGAFPSAADFPGGGGGGAGGLVMLDSPAIVLQSAIVMASGGGGGGGQGAGPSAGMGGGEPTATAPLAAAGGGVGGMMAGSGGFGSSLSAPGPGGGGIEGVGTGGAAGGGGGGAGVIRLFGPVTGTSQIVPPQS